jgi:acyl CoA:acetate/3-ketoacid CoA transferase alpha subunit
MASNPIKWQSPELYKHNLPAAGWDKVKRNPMSLVIALILSGFRNLTGFGAKTGQTI